MLKKLLLLSSVALFSNAAVTMCFLKDHSDPSTAQTTPLDGADCKSQTVEQLKNTGLELKDIKMKDSANGFNYVFIFDNATSQSSTPASSSVVITKEMLKEQIAQIQEENTQKEEAMSVQDSSTRGEKLYKSKCQSCHGNGTIAAYNTATPLLKLSKEDIEIAIRDYKLDAKDKGMAILMRPIAYSLIDKDIKDISNYLETLKK